NSPHAFRRVRSDCSARSASQAAHSTVNVSQAQGAQFACTFAFSAIRQKKRNTGRPRQSRNRRWALRPPPPSPSPQEQGEGNNGGGWRLWLPSPTLGRGVGGKGRNAQRPAPNAPTNSAGPSSSA